MKINKINIKNYRILDNVTIHPNDVLTLVGGNDSGKSTIFRALELFFENTTRLVSKESFHNYDLTKSIKIEIEFTDLKGWEKNELEAWLLDENLIVKRIISMDESENLNISTVAKIQEPRNAWLKVSEVNATNISMWKKQDLIINGKDFKEYLVDGNTTIVAWKDAIAKYIEENRGSVEFEIVEKENPKGYPNVLKGTLPEFILIPAVRDISDETKVVSTTAFGKLLDKLIKNIPVDELETLDSNMNSVKKRLNRSEEESARISQIEVLEKKLNEFMHEIMDCDIELEFEIPTVRDVIGKVKMYATDGIRTPIDMKGHGLQRSAIFTILRAYAELKNQSEESEEQSKERTTIFAFEEPELYLHPQLQRTLFNTLYAITKKGDQIFYSTHSSLLVNISLFDDICILRKATTAATCTTSEVQLTMNQLLEDLKVRKGVEGTAVGMRELYSNIFNSEISEGFFAEKVIIVEGASEKYILPIYYECLGYDINRENIAIVHAHGKGPIDRLLRIFSGFKIPTYVWFDGDKNNSEAQIKVKSIELLKMFGEDIDDIANVETTVKENYSVLENTLEDLVKSEISEYDELVSQAKAELGPGIGKPLIHKYIATQILSQIKDGSNPDDIIPPTIKAICEKIKALDTITPVLQT